MKKKRLFLTVIALAAALTVSLCLGRYPLSLADVAEILTLRCENPVRRNILINIRLPRVLLVCLAGMALSLSGWVYQNVFMNTLVSPDVLGVGSGCAIGAILAILAGAASPVIQLSSLAAGFLIVMITVMISHRIARHDSIMLLLTGIAVSALANSVIMLLKYIADPHNELAAIEYWLMGSFHNAKWSTVFSVLPVFLPCCVIVLVLEKAVHLLSLGDEEALSLGVRPGLVKYTVLFAATGMVASVVAAAGSVSWLGLIVPHIVRLGSGETKRTPYAVMLTGALLLTVADLAARTISAGEIPISILTSFMGAIFLICLLFRRRASC